MAAGHCNDRSGAAAATAVAGRSLAARRRGAPRCQTQRPRTERARPSRYQLEPAPPPRERPPPDDDRDEPDDRDERDELDRPAARPLLLVDVRVRRGVERLATDRAPQWAQVVVTSTSPP